MRLGIIVAMQKEYEMLLRTLRYERTLDESCALCRTANGFEVAIRKCGIGKVNAAIGAFELIRYYGATHIIATGCAGGADPSIEVGDIVVGNSYCYHDVWCGEPNANGQVQGMPAVFPSYFTDFDIPNEPNVKIGTIASGDWFVSTKEKIEQIRGYLPACYNLTAIDMESAAIAQVCHIFKVKFLAAKVISDNPLLPDQPKQYEDFWNDMATLSFEFIKDIIGKL